MSCTSLTSVSGFADLEGVYTLEESNTTLGTARAWKEANKAEEPYTMVWNSDWKENVMRGHGPVEDANVYHREVPTACYGVCVQYWEPLIAVDGKRKKV